MPTRRGQEARNGDPSPDPSPKGNGSPTTPANVNLAEAVLEAWAICEPEGYALPAERLPSLLPLIAAQVPNGTETPEKAQHLRRLFQAAPPTDDLLGPASASSSSTALPPQETASDNGNAAPLFLNMLPAEDGQVQFLHFWRAFSQAARSVGISGASHEARSLTAELETLRDVVLTHLDAPVPAKADNAASTTARGTEDDSACASALLAAAAKAAAEAEAAMMSAAIMEFALGDEAVEPEDKSDRVDFSTATAEEPQADVSTATADEPQADVSLATAEEPQADVSTAIDEEPQAEALVDTDESGAGPDDAEDAQVAQASSPKAISKKKVLSARALLDVVRNTGRMSSSPDFWRAVEESLGSSQDPVSYSIEELTVVVLSWLHEAIMRDVQASTEVAAGTSGMSSATARSLSPQSQYSDLAVPAAPSASWSARQRQRLVRQFSSRSGVDLPTLTVVVHIYDVSQEESIRKLNKFLAHQYSPLKLGGVFHAGVEVNGLEWSFGYSDGDSSVPGISCVEPKTHPQHQFRQSVSLRRTRCTEEDIADIISVLIEEYPGPDYDLLRRNCCHFADDFAKRLGVGGIPGWVHRLARLGARVDGVMQATLNRGLLPAEYDEDSP